MNKINFNQTGGFPLETNTLDFLQSSHADLINGLGAMAGNLAILSGCVENGNNVGNGYVQINGETLFFKGGAKMNTVVIVETSENRTFENGESKKVYLTRYAAFGSGTQNYNWADFKRVPVLGTLPDLLAQKALNSDITALRQQLVEAIQTLNTAIAAVQQNLNSHQNNTANPHSTTPAQIGIKRLRFDFGDVPGNSTSVWDLTYFKVQTKQTLSGGNGLYLLTFKPALGMTAFPYSVVPTIIGKNTTWKNDINVFINIRNIAADGFEFSLREDDGSTQDLDIEFLIIPITAF